MSFKLYDESTERLDHFWRSLISAHKCSDLFWNFLKKVLILSQGNALVERGFSVNNEIVVENQLNKSLIAQRQVYDGIKSRIGVTEVDVPKDMILKFRNSKALYQEALEEQKKGKVEKGLDDVHRKRMAGEIQALRQKKLKLLEQKQKDIEEIDQQLRDLCGPLIL